MDKQAESSSQTTGTWPEWLSPKLYYKGTVRRIDKYARQIEEELKIEAEERKAQDRLRRSEAGKKQWARALEDGTWKAMIAHLNVKKD